MPAFLGQTRELHEGVNKSNCVHYSCDNPKNQSYSSSEQRKSYIFIHELSFQRRRHILRPANTNTTTVEFSKSSHDPVIFRT